MHDNNIVQSLHPIPMHYLQKHSTSCSAMIHSPACHATNTSCVLDSPWNRATPETMDVYLRYDLVQNPKPTSYLICEFQKAVLQNQTYRQTTDEFPGNPKRHSQNRPWAM